MSDNLHDELARLLSGYWYTQTIYVAAKLDLAELLKDAPRTARQLAEATDTHPSRFIGCCGRWQASASSLRNWAASP